LPENPKPAEPLRIAVLGSHSGTNFQAIIDACVRGELNARIAAAISNNGESGFLARAKRAKIPAFHISAKTAGSEDLRDARIEETLVESGAELVVLAGYMKRLGAGTLRRFKDRVINIHPALLPSFGGAGMYGIRVHQAVLAAGTAVSGATVHLVTERYDEGPTVLQRTVPVLPMDTPEDLAARVLVCEHQLLVEAIAIFADKKRFVD
jgi:phosphoribosylglycinamide formyltransferase-1